MAAKKKLKSKKVPVKALLLDQANISGVGNWVADEVLYQAKIHPEQYSNTFNDAQIKTLHDSLTTVCTIACETLADKDQFPENWLMRHRWNKGKKNANVLPNGEKIIHLKVGGRTSAVVPSVQKKTGPVAGDVTSQDLKDEEADDDEEEEEIAAVKPKGRKGKKAVLKVEEEDDDEDEDVKVTSKKRKSTASNGVKHEEVEKTSKRAKTAPATAKAQVDTGRRRSGRVTTK